MILVWFDFGFGLGLVFPCRLIGDVLYSHPLLAKALVIWSVFNQAGWIREGRRDLDQAVVFLQVPHCWLHWMLQALQPFHFPALCAISWYIATIVLYPTQTTLTAQLLSVWFTNPETSLSTESHPLFQVLSFSLYTIVEVYISFRK